MHRLIILLLLVEMCSISSNAQHLDVGVLGGFNLAGSSYVLQDTSYNKSLDDKGLVIGGMFNYDSKSLVSLRFEVLYCEYKELTSDALIIQSYIEAPILLKINFLKYNYFQSYIAIGPNIFYLINVDYKFSNQKIKKSNESSKLGFGLEAGLGLRFLADPFFINFDFRYFQGLTKLNEGTDFITNRGLKFLFGLTLPVF